MSKKEKREKVDIWLVEVKSRTKVLKCQKWMPRQCGSAQNSSRSDWLELFVSGGWRQWWLAQRSVWSARWWSLLSLVRAPCSKAAESAAAAAASSARLHCRSIAKSSATTVVTKRKKGGVCVRLYAVLSVGSL